MSEKITEQRHMGDALGYWNGMVENGDLMDQPLWPDDSPSEDVYTLSDDDVTVIQAALKRHFIAIKKDRVQVLHAVRALAPR